MFDILRTKVESDRSTDFVALGFLYNRNSATHSAIVIQYENLIFEFHYTGQSVEYSEIYNDYYHKTTNSICPEDVPAFIAMCLQIQKKANPKYGFFYSGEFYNKAGKHFSEIDYGERMTCVGFCLNVLKGFLECDYLQYTDWDESSHQEPNYLEYYCEEHNLDINTIRGSHRRITPIELITSGFFSPPQIRKAQIDFKIEFVKEVISNKEKSRLN